MGSTLDWREFLGKRQLCLFEEKLGQRNVSYITVKILGKEAARISNETMQAADIPSMYDHRLTTTTGSSDP